MTDEEFERHLDWITDTDVFNVAARLERCNELEKENAELKAKLNGALDICNIPEFRISALEKENVELKKQIDKMKRCKNCKQFPL